MSSQDETGSSSVGSQTPRQSPAEPKPRLPVRFYKAVTIEKDGAGYRIELDGRPVKTPKRNVLEVPTEKLAQAVAAEWSAQDSQIDPSTMPLLRLVNTALDGICGSEALVAADIAHYVGSDAVCYRAQQPADLVELQEQAWDPLMAWALEDLGMELVPTQGVMPVAQPPETLKRALVVVSEFNALPLGALHVVTTITGSLVIALAVFKGRLSGEQAWLVAHIDEDYQIAKWGDDVEAIERRLIRRKEFDSALRLVSLLG